VIFIPVAMLVGGWLLVNPGNRKHRLLPVLGTLVILAAMILVVQLRH
jgi:hypothetical protein